MSRRSRQNEDHLKDDKPPAKLRKSARKKSKPCHICSLPNELLEKIVSYISYWHRPRLRRTCRRMRNVCDSALLHEFQKSILFYERFEPEGYEYAALTAIRDATWSYVLHGFDSIFCGTILPLIWNGTKCSPNPSKIKYFLKQFFKLVDAQIGDSYSKFSRLLYTVTLMRLLGKFRSSSVITSVRIQPSYWRMVLELCGPWIGILWSSKSAAESQEHWDLLIILCEILIADSTQQGFKQVWECDNEVFVYGNDASEDEDRIKKPTTVFTFNINAPHRIVSLLKSSLEGESFEWPKRMPRNEFVVFTDIACKESLKWGCCQVYHIQISPDLELKRDRKSAQTDNPLSSRELMSSSDAIVEID